MSGSFSIFTVFRLHFLKGSNYSISKMVFNCHFQIENRQVLILTSLTQNICKLPTSMVTCHFYQADQHPRKNKMYCLSPLKLLLRVETFSWNMCATALRNKFQQALHRVTWLVFLKLFQTSVARQVSRKVELISTSGTVATFAAMIKTGVLLYSTTLWNWSCSVLLCYAA